MSITIPDDLEKWLDQQIKERRFHNYQHAIEYSLDFVRSEGDKLMKEFAEFKELAKLRIQLDREKDERKRVKIVERLEELLEG